jgi:osmotically-inducible protein OsmY
MLRHFRRKLAVVLVLAASLGMMTPGANRPERRQSGKAGQKPEESALLHEIRHQIQVLPYYSVFDYVTCALEGTKVTLSGHVLRPTLRADAEAAIKSIEGVTSVSNFIEVLPKSTTDDDLRRAVYRAIFEDSVLQRYAAFEVPAIHIIVKEGTVTLEGSVESEGDKKLATSRAASVPGLSSLNNILTVRAKAAPAN